MCWRSGENVLRGMARRIEELEGKEPEGKAAGRGVEVRVSGAGLRDKDPASRPVSTPISQMLAGSLMGLMSWWLHAGQGIPAAKMDEMFHEQAWRGIRKGGG